MKTRTKPIGPSRIMLQAERAADLMTCSPLSIRADADIAEAVAFLTDKGFSAAPVIDEAGRPVGVLSRADLLVHNREQDATKADLASVGDIMTPAVYCVPPDAPADRVVKDLVDLKVHRLFVVDPDGILIGVISAVDVLRRLSPERTDDEHRAF